MNDAAGDPIVRDVSFSVDAGELFGLIGQSGSGKTTIALALLAHTRRGARIAEGSVELHGVDLLGLSDANLSHLRGSGIAYVPQDARSAITPSSRLGALLNEAAQVHPRAERRARIETALGDVGLHDIVGLERRYPHQVSGGQLQRFVLALALIGGARVIVMDEPTSALDPVTRDALIDRVAVLARDHGIAFIIVSHDVHHVATRTTQLLVLRDGEIIDSGRTDEVLARDRNEHTDSLLGVTGRSANRTGPTTGRTALVSVRNLTARYGLNPAAQPVLEHLNLDLLAGECLAVIGPSGSGKTTLARCIAGLHSYWSGSITLDNDLLHWDARKRTMEQLRAIQFVFQNPYSSLNPRHSIASLIARPLKLEVDRSSDWEIDQRVDELLEAVRLPTRYKTRYPRDLSGGECQRVALARSLATSPRMLICDEVTSALDPIVQDEVLKIINDLRKRDGLAVLMITHDHDIAGAFADRVLSLDGNVSIFSN